MVKAVIEAAKSLSPIEDFRASDQIARQADLVKKALSYLDKKTNGATNKGKAKQQKTILLGELQASHEELANQRTSWVEAAGEGGLFPGYAGEIYPRK
jgi:hypothetical protein